MNILKYEFFKLISQKMLWFLFITLFILNAFLYITEQNKYKLPVSSEYYVMEKYFDKLPKAVALSEVVKSEQELSAVSMILYLKSTKMNEELIKVKISPMLEFFQSPLTYEELKEKYKGSKFIKDDKALQEAITSISLIKEQLQYIIGYPSFINSMEQNAEEMKSISVFNKPDTFAYRNIVRTPKDFEHLKGIMLNIGDQNGIVTATGFETTNLLIMLLIFLLCICLFSQEKENGLIGLVKSNKNGRLPVILSKLSVLVTMVVLFSLLFYGSILILGNHIYGYGNMARYIQSMSEFRDCNILLTVRQYLSLFIAVKIIVGIATGIVFAMIFTLLSDAKSVYTVVFLFLGVSYLGYEFIHPVSYLNAFKYLNIFAFFNVFKLFTAYTNINLFGYAFQKVSASVLVLIVVVVSAILVNIYAFVKLYGYPGGITAIVLNKLTPKRTKISGSVNLFLHEAYKLIIGGRVYLFIIISLIIGYSSINFKPLLLDSDSAVYKRYIDSLAGKLTPQKTAFIENEQKRFDNIPQEIEKLSESFKKGDTSEADLAMGMLELTSFSENRKGFEKIKKQYEYLLSLKEKQKISGSFICELSSDYIFNNMDRDSATGLACTILLLLCLCGIFPRDYQSGMLSILKSTRHGRLRLFLIKYIIGYIIAFLLIIIIYLPYYINLLTRYSIGDWGAPIQSIRIFANLNADISIFGFVLLVNLLQLAGAFAMTSLILSISQLVEKQSFSILTGTVLFVFPFLLSLFGIHPFNFITLTNSFTLFSSFTEAEAAVSNTLYFIVLSGLSLLSIFFGAYRYNGYRIKKMKTNTAQIAEF